MLRKFKRYLRGQSVPKRLSVLDSNWVDADGCHVENDRIDIIEALAGVSRCQEDRIREMGIRECELPQVGKGQSNVYQEGLTTVHNV